MNANKEKPITFLVIDDDEKALNETAGLLEDEGYHTLKAESAERAGQIAREHSDIYVALIDVVLGEAFEGGLDVVRKFRSEHPAMRLILYSGHGSHQLKQRALEDGATFYIDKGNEADLVTASKALAEMWKLENEVKNYKFQGQWMDNVFDSVGGELLIRDPDKNVILVNRKKEQEWMRRHHLSYEAVIRKFGEIKGKKGCLDFSSAKYPTKDHTVFGEFKEHALGDGSTLSVSVNELRDETGKLRGYIEFARDVTKRKLAVDLTQKIAAEVTDQSKYPDFKAVSQLVVEILQQFVSGRVRLYRFDGKVAEGTACVGMHGDSLDFFDGCSIKNEDPDIDRILEKGRIEVQLGTWKHDNDTNLGIINASEKIRIPIFHPRRRDEAFCFITIDNEDNPDRYTLPESEDLLEMLRLAIENALWTAEQRERINKQQKWLEAFQKVDDILIADIEEDVESIYQRVFTILWETLGARSAELYWHHEKTGQFEDIYSLGGAPSRTPNPYTPGANSRKLKSLNENEIIAIPNIHEDPTCSEYLRFAGEEYQKFHQDTKGWAILPFSVGEQVKAVGAIHYDKVLDAFDPDELLNLKEMQQRLSIALVRATSHRHTQQEAIKKTERAHLGLMTAGFGHSIMNTIQTCMSQIDDVAADLDGSGKDILGESAKELEKLRDRINEIRDFVLPEGRPEKDTELVALLDALMRIYQYQADEAGITVRRKWPEKKITVCSHEGVVRMVLLDLIQNAHKFMEKDTGEKVLSINVSTTVDHVQIDIMDTGPGISPQILRALNAPAAENPESTSFGLGLHLAVSMLPTIGGRISARNRSERGAHFTITLPVQPK